MAADDDASCLLSLSISQDPSLALALTRRLQLCIIIIIFFFVMFQLFLFLLEQEVGEDSHNFLASRKVCLLVVVCSVQFLPSSVPDRVWKKEGPQCPLLGPAARAKKLILLFHVGLLVHSLKIWNVDANKET